MPKPAISASAQRARDALLQKKRAEQLAKYRAEHPPTPKVEYPTGPTHTCITCHPEEIERLFPPKPKPPPNPKGSYICYWCGDRISHAVFRFHTFIKDGQAVYEPFCQYCSRQVFGTIHGRDPAKAESCWWPEWQRKTLKELPGKVYKVQGVLVIVRPEHDTYSKKGGQACPQPSANAASTASASNSAPSAPSRARQPSAPKRSAVSAARKKK